MRVSRNRRLDPAKIPMSNPLPNFASGNQVCEAQFGSRSSRITMEEIARRLNIGRLAVYAMLQKGILPGIRLGRRWIITRHALRRLAEVTQ